MTMDFCNTDNLVVRDDIAAEWDHWVRNNADDLPDGYTGVPRLLYRRIDDDDENKRKLRSVRVTLDTDPDSVGEIAGIHEWDWLNDEDIVSKSPSSLVLDRSLYHSPTKNHAYAAHAVEDGCQFTLSLAGTYYDTDNWSDANDPGYSILDMTARPVGIFRAVYSRVDSIMSNTGLLEHSHTDSTFRITYNPFTGGYDDDPGNGYRDAWVEGRDVYLACEDKIGDPGPGWDTNNKDGSTIWDPNLEKEIRDPGDLVHTIIFKQVDP